MHTRISKIDLEMADKIEVKDDNPNFNFFCCCKKIFFSIQSQSFTQNYKNYKKVGGFSENSGNLLTDGHKNF